MSKDKAEADLTVPAADPHQTIECMEVQLTYAQVPVRVKDKDGTVKEYVIEELGGPGRDVYMNDLGQRMGDTPEGKSPSLKNFTGMIPLLLSISMRVATLDPTTNEVLSVAGFVPLDVINTWPARVQKQFSDKAKEISGLGQAEEKKVKNVSGESPNSSTGSTSP